MSEKTNTAKTIDKKDTIKVNLLFSNTGARMLTVFSTNIVVIGLFGVVGYFLDSFFATKPIILMIAIVLSFPVSIYAMTKKAKQLTKKIQLNKKNG